MTDRPGTTWRAYRPDGLAARRVSAGCLCGEGQEPPGQRDLTPPEEGAYPPCIRHVRYSPFLSLPFIHPLPLGNGRSSSGVGSRAPTFAHELARSLTWELVADRLPACPQPARHACSHPHATGAPGGSVAGSEDRTERAFPGIWPNPARSAHRALRRMNPLRLARAGGHRGLRGRRHVHGFANGAKRAGPSGEIDSFSVDRLELRAPVLRC